MGQLIRNGDTVLVNAGKDRGKTGKVSRILTKGSKRYVVVEDVNVSTKHIKNRQGVTQSGKVKFPAPIDISNVSLYDTNANIAGRVGWKILPDGNKERFVIRGKQG